MASQRKKPIHMRNDRNRLTPLTDPAKISAHARKNGAKRLEIAVFLGLVRDAHLSPLPGAERLIDGFVNGVVQATHRGIPKHKMDAGGMLAREIVKVVLGIVGCVIADTNISYPLRL